MSNSHRYPAVALGFALALHALFALAVFLLAPSHQVVPRESVSAASSRPFSIHFVALATASSSPPSAHRGPPPREWIPESVEPVVSIGTAGPAIPISVSPPTFPGGSVDGQGGTLASADGSKGGSPSLLATPESARRIVYVVDRSISMGHTGALAWAKREIVQAIRTLPPEARFQVVAYNNVALPLGTADWMSPSHETIRAIEQRFAGLWAGGSTDHVSALKRALLLRPDLVFLLTDADDLKNEGVSAIGRANVARAVIHVVELSAGKTPIAETPLMLLARRNGGSHRRVAPE